MGSGIINSLADCIVLFCSQGVRNNSIKLLQKTAIGAEIKEVSSGNRPSDVKPFSSLLALNAQLAKIGMEVMVSELFARAIIKNGVAFPFQFVVHICSVGLLLQPLLHTLFSVANLRPPLCRMISGVV